MSYDIILLMDKRLVWLYTCFIISLLIGLVYISAQQILRLDANDPQVQIVQDVSASLNAGAQVPQIVQQSSNEVKDTLAPFLVIYDKNGKALVSSGMINGKIPTPPQGVFDAAKNSQDHRFSWAPESGVREAAVVSKYKDGFVLAARSLKETEIREDLMLKYAAAAWFFGIAATTALFFIFWDKKLNLNLPKALPKFPEVPSPTSSKKSRSRKK